MLKRAIASIALLSFIFVTACKKDKQHTNDSVIVGSWTTQSFRLTAYDVKTGKQNDNFGYDIEKPSSVAFNSNGKYSYTGAGNSHGTYTYDDTRKQLILEDSNGQADTATVNILNVHQLQYTGSKTSEGTRIIIEASFTK